MSTSELRNCPEATRALRGCRCRIPWLVEEIGDPTRTRTSIDRLGNGSSILLSYGVLGSFIFGLAVYCIWNLPDHLLSDDPFHG